MDKRRWSQAFIALAGLAAMHVVPAQALDSGDVTGDVTDPTLHSFTLTPDSADVTDAPATFSVSLQISDDLSGVGHVSLAWSPPPFDVGHGVNLTLTSGHDRDGTWTGSFTVPRYSPEGEYELFLSIADRVHNGRSFDADDLVAEGFPGRFTVTDDNPDATPPTLRAVRITPTSVDVREGPATVAIEVDAADDQSGLQGTVAFVFAPNGNAGGVRPPGMVQVAGTTAEGTWRGTATVPRYTQEGRFRIELRLHDRLINVAHLPPDRLEELGMANGFDVTSEPDLDAPRLASFSMSPIEVNVHDADQTVDVRARVTDDLAGVAQYWSDTNLHDVQVMTTDPVTGQDSGVGGLAREEGTALDGVYEGSIVVPKSSATGLRQVRVYAGDSVSNARFVTGDDLVAAGGTATLLVYNVPLPPILRDVAPGDAAAEVRWDPPVDERGAAVTEYIVRETPDGVVKRLDGGARSVVVDGLRNGISHTFTVTAVNKAGPSDPSAPRSAVPRPAESPATTPTAPSTDDPAFAAPRGSGYSMVSAVGAVYAFGAAPWLGNAPVGSTPAVDIEATPSGAGYWVVDARGQVFAFGDAPYLGSGVSLTPGETATSLSGTPSGRGYWVFTTRGRVLSYGDARHHGDLGGISLNGPVLDSVPTPSGNGYYMVASDGGVFAFGDARFAGSMGATRLNAPVQSLVPDPDGAGYWLVASDGGIFAFEAPFHGSMGGSRLNRPVTGMVGSPTGGGYLMVAEDGGIFAFGDVPFHGSLGDRPPPVPIAAVAATSTSG